MNMTLQDKIEAILEEDILNSPALRYANDMITLNAVRTGGNGWTGEPIDIKKTAAKIAELLGLEK
mgnify:CR=1 FL=1